MSNAEFDSPLSGPAAGYPGHHSSNPNQLPQLLEAANNCIQNFCLVQPDEKVLVVAEPDTDPLVVASFSTAATLAGAEVATMTVRPFTAGGQNPGAPGDMLMGAYEQADVIVALTYFEFAHAERTFFSEIFGGDKRVCSVIMSATPGALVTAGRFPMDLYLAIARLAYSRIEGCRSIRYVTATGTDIEFQDPQGIGYSEPLKPGSWSIFPPMGINFYPLSAKGVFVPDETTIHGRPLAPIKFTVTDGFVTDVQAGAEADVAAVESYANGRYYLRHSVIGLNPKTRIANAPQFERERAAGTSYLGIDGTGPDGVIDRNKAGRAHLDAIFDTPSVYIDGELLVNRRRLLLLEDADLLDFARQFGDPQRILAQNPFIW